MGKKIEIKSGERYGNLTVVKEVERLRLPSGQTNRAFLMKCDCGNKKIIRLSHFSRGLIKTCGCNQHGYTGTHLYNVWRGMITRCRPNAIDHHIYYDKGIRVCSEWENFSQFKDWALLNGYRKDLTIDRIDNSKGYSPNNCRFITMKQNCNNRDVTLKVEYKGSEYAFTELIDKKNLRNHQYTIRRRINRGWSVNDAIDTPIRQGNYQNRWINN